MIKVGTRLIYYSGGHDKTSRDGVFTVVTHVTKTGRFKIKIDNSQNYFHPESLMRMGNRISFGSTPSCLLINDENKKFENIALRRLWIDRISRVDMEEVSENVLKSIIGVLNVNKI